MEGALREDAKRRLGFWKEGAQPAPLPLRRRPTPTLGWLGVGATLAAASPSSQRRGKASPPPPYIKRTPRRERDTPGLWLPSLLPPLFFICPHAWG